MEVNDLKVGGLYSTEFVIAANYICADISSPFHEAYEITPGEVFMIIDFTEIEATSSLDVEILFEGKKMWFTFHRHVCMIDDVRRAESYDIPFVALQEVEPGSNSSSFQTSPHPPKPSEEALLTFISFSDEVTA